MSVDNTAQKISEIEEKLSSITETLDSIAERFDVEIDALKKQVDLAAQAAANAPNRTGTVLEKNQQMIWNKLGQIATGLTQSGVQIEALKPDGT